MIDLEMLVIADFLLFVYLSFESTLPHFPSRTLNDRFITTTPHYVTTTNSMLCFGGSRSSSIIRAVESTFILVQPFAMDAPSVGTLPF